MKQLVFFICFMCALIFTLGNSCASTSATKLKVVLISVATEEEAYWASIHNLGKAAAANLGIDFEIMYSYRDHIKAVQIAKELSASEDKPDYVIVVGEKRIAAASIPVLSDAGIKVFMFGDMTASEKDRVGNPREIYKNYIGQRTINDYEAGYLTAQSLVEFAVKNKMYDADGKINILAFEGVRQTIFSSQRVKGFNQLLKKYPQVKLLQSIQTDWTYDYASKVMPKLTSRYSDKYIAGIWCANSAMARAVSDFYKVSGKQNGRDYVTVGIDWGIPAVKSVSRGGILTIAGGHVAEVAWILTLIYDYHHGRDFAHENYLSTVSMMDKALAKKYLEFFQDNKWDCIDFSNHSKVKNPSLKQYNMSFTQIISDVSGQNFSPPHGEATILRKYEHGKRE